MSKSWRSCSLSFSGKALVINALALSRIWYVALLVFLPAWARAELTTLIFNFFWSGKRDLVSRKVLVHPCSSLFLLPFSVVSIEFKVQSLLVRWVKRLSVSPNGWVNLLTYWLLDRFGASPTDVFSDPHGFPASCLPPF